MQSLNNNTSTSSKLGNYIGEVAITMLFGMGYYVVNKFNKKDDKQKINYSFIELIS